MYKAIQILALICWRLLIWTVAVCWLGVSFAACPTSNHNAVTGENPVADTVLTYQDNGKSIDTLVGNCLTVQLKESPTTGYVWVNKTTGDVLLLQNTGFSPASPPGVLGGAGMRMLRFMVSKAGKSTLLLKQMREWEGESSSVEVFSVTINAKQP
ncbi:MAG: protease inhibitor I42 family protein [Methylococcales bacterium]|nr:protease inhibitor I42 family protein [Methylococcales bacterium]MDD5633159.1 protease inhibitor I42 family protein [Methylococcales bacterium]